MSRKNSRGNLGTTGSQKMYHMMMAPGMLFLLIFSYIPMIGIIMAFQDYVPSKGLFGSPFVGLKHFQYMFSLPDIALVMKNTLVIALGKIILGTFMAIAFSIILNEIRIKAMKKWIQTIVYLPHFLSWVVLASVVVNLFNLDGSVNQMISGLGLEKVNFLGSNHWFQPLIIGTDVWKEFGYNSVVYLAAMNLTSILSAGFDQVYNLYTPLVYESGDILDTYVYRMGLIGRQYSFATAVGLLKSLIGMLLMVGANEAAKRFADRKIF